MNEIDPRKYIRRTHVGGESLSAYGRVAVEAVKRCVSSAQRDPSDAWVKVARLFLLTEEGRKKSCPKSAFLGLCEDGLVRGIPRGSYTRSRLNKSYALLALRALRHNPSLVNNASKLWLTVMAGEEKRPNGQMDVVIALWKSELLCVEE